MLACGRVTRSAAVLSYPPAHLPPTTRKPSHPLTTHTHIYVHTSCIYSDSKTPLAPQAIQDQLSLIVASAAAEDAPLQPASRCLPALTALGRTRWAEIREDAFGQGLNRLSLEEIETAMFVLHLDASAPTSWSETGRLSLLGDQGCSLWCDKSFNIIVFANGEASMHVEHSWADAPVMAHAWEWVLCQENLSNCYDAAGNLTDATDTACQARTPGSQPASPQLASRAASAASSSATCTSSRGGKLAAHAQPVSLQWQFTAMLGMQGAPTRARARTHTHTHRCASSGSSPPAKAPPSSRQPSLPEDCAPTWTLWSTALMPLWRLRWGRPRVWGMAKASSRREGKPVCVCVCVSVCPVCLCVLCLLPHLRMKRIRGC